MPVIGHAFVGLAIGMATQKHHSPEAPANPWREGAWLPLAVTLAYLPDIAGKTLAFSGVGSARPLSHSLVFALGASAAFAPFVAWVGRIPLRRSAGLCLFSMVGHLFLDLAQHTDRAPLWPLSTQRLSMGILPTGSLAELFLFGGGFLCFLTVRRAVKRRDPAALVSVRPSAKAVWVTRCGVAVILAAAMATHSLRGAREYQLRKARELVLRRDYVGAVAAVASAARWPSTARPGRLDYLLAEAYAGLGNTSEAEHHYLRSYGADPDYFWCIADLALFYARSQRPQTERERLTAPYLTRLRSDFPEDPNLATSLARIEGALNRNP